MKIIFMISKKKINAVKVIIGHVTNPNQKTST